MSDHMYPTRLRWHHTAGCARHAGVHVELRRCPELPGWQSVTEIDYVPSVIAHVRHGCGPTLEMTAEEQAMVLGMLRRMADACRAAIG